MGMRKLYCDEKKLSYAQKFLLDMADKRCLHKFWAEKIKTEKYNFFYVFLIATGKNSVSLNFIWDCRKVINPVDWFATISEPRLEPIPVSTARGDYDYTKSLNFKKLLAIPKLREWSIANSDKGADFYKLWLVKTQHRKITFFRIKEFKNIFPIGDWFLYR